jgi:hypothetical protein
MYVGDPNTAFVSVSRGSGVPSPWAALEMPKWRIF